MEVPKTLTETLIEALKILSVDIQSEDGVANSAIAEAAQRLEELHLENIALKNDLHQPELCNERYNRLVVECNEWEELCDDMYDFYDTPPSIEERYFFLKKHYGE